MYCNNCGKNNPEGSKFCQHCGIKHTNIGKNTKEKSIDKPIPEKSSTKKIDSSDAPYPYVISISKLIVMSITTFGLYEIYWFYKQFKSFKSENEWKITPLARAIFAPFTAKSLFDQILKSTKKIDKNASLPSLGLAITFFLLNALWRLPDYYWLLAFLSFLPLMQVQKTINHYWEEKYKNRLIKANFNKIDFVIALLGGILLFSTLITMLEEDSYSYSDYDYSSSTSDSDTDLATTYRENFIDECTSESSELYSYCVCAIDYLEDNYTLGERIRLDTEYIKTEVMPDAMLDAMDECSYLFD